MYTEQGHRSLHCIYHRDWTDRASMSNSLRMNGLYLPVGLSRPAPPVVSATATPVWAVSHVIVLWPGPSLAMQPEENHCHLGLSSLYNWSWPIIRWTHTLLPTSLTSPPHNRINFRSDLNLNFTFPGIIKRIIKLILHNWSKFSC